MEESEKELKSLLMRMKEESEKVDLNSIFKKSKIMVSSPITSWQIKGKQCSEILYFGGSKITADDDFSHEKKNKTTNNQNNACSLEETL